MMLNGNNIGTMTARVLSCRPLLNGKVMFAIFLVGVVVGYAGNNLIGVSNNGEDVAPAISARTSGCPVPTEPREVKLPYQGIQNPFQPPTAVGKVNSSSPLRTRAPNSLALAPAQSIDDLHKSMPDAGPDLWVDPYNPDQKPLHEGGIPTGVSQSQEAYLRHSELIAEQVAELNPPTGEPDENELENPFFYDNLPEIEEWEEAELLLEGELSDTSPQPLPWEEAAQNGPLSTL